MTELIGNPDNLDLAEYVEQLQTRLAETEEILRAIRNGEIDALMVEGNTGEQMYTLKGADALYRLFVEEMMQGAITVNTRGLILYCNRRFSQFLRWPQEQIIGQPITKFINPPEIAFFNRLLDISRQENSRGEIKLQDSEGNLIPFELALNPLWVDEALQSICVVATDLSTHKQAEQTLKTALQEKEVLLKEVHHRVKNNLQVISSFLGLQISNLQEEHTIEILQESQNRVRSMALIHENLYNSEDLSRVNFASYIQQLAGRLFQTYNILSSRVSLQTYIEEVQLEIEQTISCGLIVNELITNSLKYAFPPDGAGAKFIKVSLAPYSPNPEKLCLEVADNGIGLPPDFDLDESETLGFQIVATLARQLCGTLNLDSQPQVGTRVQIIFPRPTLD